MEISEISLDSFKTVLGEIIDISPSQLNEDMDIRYEFGIDSLGLVSMGNKIENYYHIEIEAAKMVTIITVGQLYSYVKDCIEKKSINSESDDENDER